PCFENKSIMENRFLIENAFLNGEFIGAKQTFPVIDPATGDTIGRLPDLTVADCQRFIDVAYDAWQDWKSTTVVERSSVLRKLYVLVQEHAEELAQLMTAESGKPIQESRTEITYANS